MTNLQKDELRVGDLRLKTVTVPQAAHILDMTVEKLRKSFDAHVVLPTMTVQGHRQIRELNGLDVFVLSLKAWMNPTIRKMVSSQLSSADNAVSIETAIVDRFAKELQSHKLLVGFIAQEACSTLDKIAKLESNDTISSDGVIAGTQVSAHRIAALREGGMAVEEVLADYPDLNRSQIEASVAYAKLNPKQGRPYPAKTVKSLRRKGRGGGLSAAFAAADAAGGTGE